jgi:nucleoside-diphosphate-sugar epimerase
MARFTVLGAGGFIGGALCSYLRAEGHEVLAPGRDAGLSPRPGHVIYAIGLTADFRSRPFDTAEAHLGRLTDLLRQDGFESFLYLSSTRVYQGAASTAETAPLQARPLDPGHLYNLTKLAGEALVLHCGLPGTRVVRLSNIVGPGEAARDTFLGALAREAATGTIRLQSHPASAKDYLWIGDALPLLTAISLHGRARIYNLASGRQLRHDDWTGPIAAATGARLETVPDAPDAGFPAIDIGRLSAEFGASPGDPRAHLAAILRDPDLRSSDP